MEQQKDHQIKVLVCTPSIVRPSALEQLVLQLKAQPSYSLADIASFNELTDSLPVVPTGVIVILGIQDKTEFVHVLQFLAAQEKSIQLSLIKVIVFSKLDNRRATSILKSKGVFDSPECNISVKALGYKFKNALQVIEQGIETYRKHGVDGANAANRSAHRNAHQQSKGVVIHKIVWATAIEHFSDFWIVLNPKQVRFLIGKWMVNFFGPGPSAGTWEETKLEINGEAGWTFQPRNPSDRTFYKDEGRWLFFGNCPEFSWEQRLWYFVSKRPCFYFYADDTILYKKIELLDTGDCMISSNSDHSTQIKQAITDSIDSSFHLRTEHQKTGNYSVENDNLESKELSATLDKDEVTEFDYRGEKEKDGIDFDYRGTNPEELEKMQAAYEAIELSINITAKNGKKLDSNELTHLVELRETQAILDIPASFLAVGDQIELVFNMKNGSRVKELSFNAWTTIVETEVGDSPSVSELRAVAICELNQTIKGHFTDLVDHLQAKRELMNIFFKSAKGERQD